MIKPGPSETTNQSNVRCLHLQSMVNILGIFRSWLSFMQQMNAKTLLSGILILMLQLEYPVDIVTVLQMKGRKMTDMGSL